MSCATTKASVAAAFLHAMRLILVITMTTKMTTVDAAMKAKTSLRKGLPVAGARELANLDACKEGFVQHGCTSYYNTGYAYRPFDSKYDGFNAEDCSNACENKGYEFFGYECPMNNRVHCQCYTADKIGEKSLEEAICKDRVGKDGDKHCTGPSMMDDVSLGGADIGSIYEVGRTPICDDDHHGDYYYDDGYYHDDDYYHNDYHHDDTEDCSVDSPCPTEEFCNFDYGSSGFCENCPIDVSCFDDGLPLEGAENCKLICENNDNDNDNNIEVKDESKYTTDYVQRGCTKYNAGARSDARPLNTPLQAGNAETCSAACRDKGFPFFGFECPMGPDRGNKVHCQCYSNARISDKSIENMDCKTLVGGGGDKHCVGSGMIDGLSMGGADIGSIYEVPGLVAESEDEYGDVNLDELLWSLQEPYITIQGQSELDDIGEDIDSIGLTAIFNGDNVDQVLVKTWDGSWVKNFYLPSPRQLNMGSKFQINCGSTWGVNIYYTNKDGTIIEKRLNTNEELLLILLEDDVDGSPAWFTKEDYVLSTTSEVEYTKEYVQRGCTKYNAGARYDARPLNTLLQVGNAETCSTACRDKGFPFFGFECPMGSGRGNKVHCQCYSDARISDKSVENMDCKMLVGGGGDKHCVGSGMIDGLSMGGADIGSIYEVPELVADGMTTLGTEYVQRGCTKYNAGPRFDARSRQNVPMKAGNAEQCSAICEDMGFPFFGFECPMSNNQVHCQCYSEDRINNKLIESLNCKSLVGGGGDKHCTGDAIVDGLSMGGADIGSIYEVPGFVPTKPATNGYGERLGKCRGSVCGLWGDPHIVTCDGLAYDCQATGIFTLMKNHLYNIQGNFVPVGAKEQAMVGNAAITNDVVVQYVADPNVPVMQFSFPDIDAFISESGCVVGQHYDEPLNMVGSQRTAEPSLQACHDRCANFNGCTKFSFWGNGHCHLNDDTSKLVKTDPTWSRSVSGSVGTCGLVYSLNAGELDNLRPVGPQCPLLFYLDGELQDIRNVDNNAYLYGDESTAHSVKLVHNQEILIVNRSGSSVSEAKLRVSGSGPGKIWSCHWNFNVCLPETEQEQLEEYSVGLLGTPDGNTQNDWMDITGQTLPIQGGREGAFEYCRKNWCVSEEESIMTYYPSGATYDDFNKCDLEEPFVPFDPEMNNCVLSAEKIKERCADLPPSLVEACQIDCCAGGCSSRPPNNGDDDDNDDDIKGIETFEAPEFPPLDFEFVYDPPPEIPDPPICTESYKELTGDTVCPDDDFSGIVKVVRQSADIPDEEPVLYGIVIQPRTDEDTRRVVKFRVDNPFDNNADIYVQYMERAKAAEYLENEKCQNMLDTAGCDPDAPEIVVGCHEGGIDAPSFALVDVFFVSNEDPFILENADPDTEVHKCCRPLDYNDNGRYGVIHYTFEIQCSCPGDDDGSEIF